MYENDGDTYQSDDCVSGCVIHTSVTTFRGSPYRAVSFDSTEKRRRAIRNGQSNENNVLLVRKAQDIVDDS